MAVGIDNAPAAFKHCGGVVDADNPAVTVLHVLAHGEGGRAEGTAEVVEAAARCGEAPCEQAGHGDDGAVAGYGAADHVREHLCYPVIEAECGRLGYGVSVDVVALFGHG